MNQLKNKKLLSLVAVVALGAGLAACGGSGSASDTTTASGGTTPTGASTLSGSGSTFVWNIVDSCRAAYSKSSVANPSTDVVSYSGGGSGTGKSNFSDATGTPTVQWAATDSIYSSNTPKSSFVYVPLVAGAISVMYHVEGVQPANSPIQLSPLTIGKIFSGQITSWDDADIKADNAVGKILTLPATPIRVYYRSGTSGTTNNFTKFLNLAAGSIWTNSANDAFTTAFPGTITNFAHILSAAGSDGVANNVRDNNGGITFVEQSYVEERKDAAKGIDSASVKNNAGVYVAPSAASTGSFYAEAAVDASGVITPDYTMKAADAYLINAVSYGVGYTASSTVNAAVRSWFTYFVGTCAPETAAAAFYAPLTGALKDKALVQAALVGKS